MVPHEGTENDQDEEEKKDDGEAKMLCIAEKFRLQGRNVPSMSETNRNRVGLLIRSSLCLDLARKT